MNALELRRRVLMMAQKKSRLPSEYQEVEYLESTGTQYIVTPIYPANNKQYECCFRFDNADVALSDANIFGGYINGNNRTQFTYGSGFAAWGDNYAYLTLEPDTAKHIVVADKTAFKLDGIDIYYPTNYSFIDNAYQIPIFGRIGWDGYQLARHLSIYCFLVREDARIILNLVPCYRKSDSKPGMYDLVTKTFFTNQGTGEFIVGADVN